MGSPTWLEFYIAIVLFGAIVIISVRIMLRNMNKRLDKQIADFKAEAKKHWYQNKDRSADNATAIPNVD